MTRYQCFGEEPQGFDRILPFNIIIGRNNAGKSALLDLIGRVAKHDANDAAAPWATDSVVLEQPITAQHLARIADMQWKDPATIIGQRLTWCPESTSALPNQVLREVPPDLLARHEREFWEVIAKGMTNPFRDKRFARILADRDIKPEPPDGPRIDPNGTGTTSTVHHFRSNADRESALVERIMLRDLNAIFEPDTHFTRIDTRDHGGRWEIYLDEEHKGRVPLSRSGSGIKTVILILAYLHLLPKIQNVAPVHYFYAFEELENNLHPAVHRRLLRFLKETSEQIGCHFFLTTHSPVEIDYFAKDQEAQVLHVIHDGRTATVRTVNEYLAGKDVLDDLDLRASDLLQSNGVIWVEGPSDRIYLNQWIELATNGELREGTHYQILEYGGALLAHLDAEPPDQATDTIHLLTINRNAAVLMDSDRHEANAPLKPTPIRIIEEVKRTGGLSWVTAGRTIENYLPVRLVTSDPNALPGQYDDMIAYLRNHQRTGTGRLPTDKVKLARRLTPVMTGEDLMTLDLKERVAELCERIRKWNQLVPQAGQQ